MQRYARCALQYLRFAVVFVVASFIFLNGIGWLIDLDGKLEQGTRITTHQIPLSKKMNPVWWFKNDTEPEPPAWYMPHVKSAFQREFMWHVRNPLFNFRNFVVGVTDKNYTVAAGPAGVWTVQRNDLNPPERGFQRSVIRLGILRLPFISYSGDTVVWYVGWQPFGIFGAKFNIRRGPNLY